MKAPKVIFVCSECGCETTKWVGKCPDCGSWNTMEEQAPVSENKNTKRSSISSSQPPVKFEDLCEKEYCRSTTGIGELDRVLGGGVVDGSVVLLSGEPGIGKSTLLLQICSALAKNKKVLYVSGEESRGQLQMRYHRLKIDQQGIWLLTETNTDAIIAECEKLTPDIVVIDSVQVLYSDKYTSGAGSMTQVREGVLSFIGFAKRGKTAVFLVGHVNKEGGISGPKMLEHMVDAVLYFEGERTQSYRLIRAIKNRFGSTNEIGVFEMTELGLREIKNPSAMMMDQRTGNVSGSCVCCVMEGTRPLLTEVQALVSHTVYSAPRRTADGFDYNRLCLLLAVLERRIRGLKFYENDIYINIAGGLRIDEPASDLAVAAALISGYTDRILPLDMVAFGEIGLAGEVRAVSHAEQRAMEAARLGFKRILLPQRNLDTMHTRPKDAQLIGISNIYEISAHLLAQANVQDTE